MICRRMTFSLRNMFHPGPGQDRVLAIDDAIRPRWAAPGERPGLCVLSPTIPNRCLQRLGRMTKARQASD
jgi:hypothetical protein